MSFMVRPSVILLAIIVSAAPLRSDETSAQSSVQAHLHIVIPEEDSVRTDLSRYRISGNTHPEGTAFINGKPVRVYPSGAFVGLVNLAHGENVIRISVTSPGGELISRDMTIFRSPPLVTSPEDRLVIEDALMEPSRDYWLNAGDVLEVKFKGSPGLEASFEIDGVVRRTPMRELPPAETGGIRGIYTGEYTVDENDRASDVPVRFRLYRNILNVIEFDSWGRVSIMPEKFPFIGRVTGRLPTFNVGLATDRLGGTRYGFTQPGVLLKIDGKAGSFLRVRLDDEITAWIHTQYVELLSDNVPPPQAEAGAIRVAGSPSADVITLELGVRLPYLNRQLVNPNRIAVDIFGVAATRSWVTQHSTAEGIDDISWRQVSGEHYRLEITLGHDVHWGHRISYDGSGNMHIVVRRPPILADPDRVLQGAVIAVDAGHGGGNLGALGSTGVFEKDINMAISHLVRRILIDRGARVVMTRTGDYDVGIRDRINRATGAGADLFVSIHCNSIGYASDPERIRGSGMYYKHVGFRSLAELMYERFLGLGFEGFGVVGNFNFLLNDLLEMPNVLIETAFLSNPEDEMKLMDEAMQTRIAEAIADGIEEYYRRYGTLIIEERS
jgi:N-acetylmuramoyl-L-alanine amidase